MAGGVEYSKGAHLTIKNKHVADIFLLKRGEKTTRMFFYFRYFLLFISFIDSCGVGIARVNV